MTFHVHKLRPASTLIVLERPSVGKVKQKGRMFILFILSHMTTGRPRLLTVTFSPSASPCQWHMGTKGRSATASRDRSMLV